jgi:hypothetical protein
VPGRYFTIHNLDTSELDFFVFWSSLGSWLLFSRLMFNHSIHKIKILDLQSFSELRYPASLAMRLGSLSFPSGSSMAPNGEGIVRTFVRPVVRLARLSSSCNSIFSRPKIYEATGSHQAKRVTEGREYCLRCFGDPPRKERRLRRRPERSETRG